MPEQSRCCRCGAYFYGDGTVCPACLRNEAAEQAAQKRHDEQIAAQEETQALIEEQMERMRTENCLRCGTPVHTGEGSGLYYPRMDFPGDERHAILAAVRAGKLTRTFKPYRHEKDTLTSSVPFAPGPGVMEALSPLLADYDEDVSANIGSSCAVGPYCSKPCFDEALATDPRFAKAEEDRARIAAKWERISSMPEWAALVASYKDAEARLEKAVKAATERWSAARLREGKEKQKKAAQKNFVVFLVIVVAAFFGYRSCNASGDLERGLVQAHIDESVDYAIGEERPADSPDLSAPEKAAAAIAGSIVARDAEAFFSSVRKKSVWYPKQDHSSQFAWCMSWLHIAERFPDGFRVGTGFEPRDGYGKKCGGGRVILVPVVFYLKGEPYRVTQFTMVKDGGWKLESIGNREQFRLADGTPCYAILTDKPITRH